MVSALGRFLRLFPKNGGDPLHAGREEKGKSWRREKEFEAVEGDGDEQDASAWPARPLSKQSRGDDSGMANVGDRDVGPAWLPLPSVGGEGGPGEGPKEGGKAR